MTIRVAITGLAVEAPVLAGATKIGDLFGRAGDFQWAFDPAQKLGKKGLRYKETATLMALCAGRTALLSSGHLQESGDAKVNDDQFGIAMASNTGNLETICNVADKIRTEHVDATSPMDLPNASSNVVASTAAIRFGLRAMNLMLTSGASASADALVLAVNSIRSGRVNAMMVGAVEVDSLALRSLQSGKRLTEEEAAGVASIVPIATCVILESEASAKKRNAHIFGYIDDYEMQGGGKQAQERFSRFVLQNKSDLVCMDSAVVSSKVTGFVATDLAEHAQVVNLETTIGQLYGGISLAQVVYACERFASEQSKSALLVSGASMGDQRLTALTLVKAYAD